MAAKKKTKKTGVKWPIKHLSGPPPGDVGAALDSVGESRLDWLKDHCRTLAGTTEDVKWIEAHVFSVGKKMYAIFSIDDSAFMFKCDEEDFDLLTEREGIIPAPYAAKMGWVSVRKNAKLPRAETRKLLTKAHGLIGAKLSKKLQRELGLLE